MCQNRTLLKGDRAFIIAGPKVWNSLPPNIRAITKLADFKKKLFLQEDLLVCLFLQEELLVCLLLQEELLVCLFLQEELLVSLLLQEHEFSQEDEEILV